MNTNYVGRKLNNKEKQDLIKDILGDRYTDAGDNFPLLSKIIDNIGYVDNAFTLAELLTYTNTMISGSRFLMFAASSASVLSIFLSPVSNMIAIINAWQTGHRMYAFRAVAYTITAWVYDKPTPAASPAILSNIRSGGLVRDESIVKEYADAWREASLSTLVKIKTGLASSNIPDKALKNILRTLSDNNPSKLSEILLVGFEDQFGAIPKMTWKSNYKILYPR